MPDAPATDEVAEREGGAQEGVPRAAWVLTLGIAVAAVALYAGHVAHLERPDTALTLHWWLLAPAFAVAERFVVHLKFRHSSHAFSLGDVPVIFGLLFAAPFDLAVAALVGPLVAFAVSRDVPLIKALFNLAQFQLGACAAATVLHLLVPAVNPVEPATWAALLAASLTTVTLSGLLIAAAIQITEGGIGAAEVAGMLRMDAVVSLTNTMLVVAVATVVDRQPLAGVLLALPAGIVFVAYRAYLRERERGASLEFLYETTQTLAASPSIDQAVKELLDRARDAFRVEIAEVVLHSPEDRSAVRTTVGPGDHHEVMVDTDPEAAAALAELVAAGEEPIALGPALPGGIVGRHLGERGVRHGILAPLRGETRLVGTLVLANKTGVDRSFGAEEIRLLETLAHNTSVALEYDRVEQSLWQLRSLQGKLEHQAFHDALTGLCNRVLFRDRVTTALARRDATVTVFYLDLDGFKRINDTMGHGAGDQLLGAVARRLESCVRPGDTVARLGGDEFAVLVDHTDDMATGSLLAERMLETLRAPFTLAGRTVRIGASIGIATGAQASGDSDGLLRCADLAMYRAKRSGKSGFRWFQPALRAAADQRQRLQDDLQAAIEREEFAVLYQPIVALEDGHTAATEALVRWDHPTRGRLGAGDFIPLAEETGLIVAVGEQVLRRAAADAARWLHPDVSVHVNLSPIELQQRGLADRLRDALRDGGLAPERLVVEVTESVLIGDSDRALENLRDARDVGVKLALDDFGTGYSSLSYIRTLPLDILKIAKTFVDDVSSTDERDPFVRLIVELARSLDLRVVAEGVETAPQRDALRGFGADFGQGFLFARPGECADRPAARSDVRPSGLWTPAALAD